MALFTNPITGKSYTYKGFTPTKRVSTECHREAHDDLCGSSPQHFLKITGDFEFAKKHGCLCQCHFTEGESK